MTARTPRRVHAIALALCVLIAWGPVAWGGVVVRALLEPGVFAAIKNARTIWLECRPPAGDAAEAFLGKYLADPSQWKQYAGRLAVAIPFDQLKPEAQRTVLLTIFKDDLVTEHGWWHTVQFAGASGMETVWTLCEWLTGKGTNYKVVEADPRNLFHGPRLERGQQYLVPALVLAFETIVFHRRIYF